VLSIRSVTGYGGMVLLAWAIVWPYPAEALAGVLLPAPWLGLVLIAARDGRLNLYPKPMTIAEIEKGWWRLPPWAQGSGRRVPLDPPPAIAGLTIAPLVALGWLAAFGGHSLDVYPLFAYGAALGLAVTAVAWLVDKTIPEARQGKTWLLVVGLTYGAAGAPVLNQAFDQGRPQVFQTSVTRKYATHGRYGAYRHLLLAPWGPVTQADNEIDVGTRFYSSVSEGEAICVVLHPGLLTAPWYEVAHCTGGMVTPTPPTLLPAI
jgi:hypothetical protein